MLWPLSWVRLRLGAVPRMETRSPSPNSREMLTPLTRCRASATFLSGNLPTSSEVITSTTAWDSRLTSSDSFKLARMPVTRTVSTSSLAGVAACSESAAACFASASDTAAAIKDDFLMLIKQAPRIRYSCGPIWSQYSTNRPEKTSLLSTTRLSRTFINKKHWFRSQPSVHAVLSGIALVILRWHGLHTSGGDRLANSFAGIAAAR